MCHKTEDFVFTKNPTFGVDGGGDGGGDDGRISSNLQPPLPIAPRDEISRSGNPLTPTNTINITNTTRTTYFSEFVSSLSIQ